MAWAKYTNAAGGINGHPVEMIVKDDGQNPATSLQDAKALVEQDRVVAIVGETSEIDSTWEKYVDAHGIPVVGGVSLTAPFLTDPNYFPSGAQLMVVTAALAHLASTAGRKHLGVYYCAESPVCAELDPITRGAATYYGMRYSSGKISATAPSYAAPCLASRTAGVDAIYVADNAPVVQRFLDQCAQQGYRPLPVMPAAEATGAWLADPVMQGAMLPNATANPFDASLPAIQTFRAAMTRYAPGVLQSSNFSFATLDPWVGGQLFAAAATAAHLTPSSTPADVKRGLYALRGETLGGLTPPLTFTKGKPALIPCYFSATIENKRFTSDNHGKPTCLSAAQAGKLVKALG